MSRYEEMWHDLEARVTAGQRAPISDATDRALQWVLDAMDLVWNEHRHKKDEPTPDLYEANLGTQTERVRKGLMPMPDLTTPEPLSVFIGAIQDTMGFYDPEEPRKAEPMRMVGEPAKEPEAGATYGFGSGEDRKEVPL